MSNQPVKNPGPPTRSRTNDNEKWESYLDFPTNDDMNIYQATDPIADWPPSNAPPMNASQTANSHRRSPTYPINEAASSNPTDPFVSAWSPNADFRQRSIMPSTNDPFEQNLWEDMPADHTIQTNIQVTQPHNTRNASRTPCPNNGYSGQGQALMSHSNVQQSLPDHFIRQTRPATSSGGAGDSRRGDTTAFHSTNIRSHDARPNTARPNNAPPPPPPAPGAELVVRQPGAPPTSPMSHLKRLDDTSLHLRFSEKLGELQNIHAALMLRQARTVSENEMSQERDVVDRHYADSPRPGSSGTYLPGRLPRGHRPGTLDPRRVPYEHVAYENKNEDY